MEKEKKRERERVGRRRRHERSSIMFMFVFIRCEWCKDSKRYCLGCKNFKVMLTICARMWKDWNWQGCKREQSSSIDNRFEKWNMHIDVRENEDVRQKVACCSLSVDFFNWNYSLWLIRIWNLSERIFSNFYTKANEDLFDLFCKRMNMRTQKCVIERDQMVTWRKRVTNLPNFFYVFGMSMDASMRVGLQKIMFTNRTNELKMIEHHDADKHTSRRTREKVKMNVSVVFFIPYPPMDSNSATRQCAITKERNKRK